ncbi:putative peptidoglycan biosynthesis protein MurJ [compost metagenome]
MARGLLGIASAIALLTLLSKAFGFGRELVVAAVYGAGDAKDAYTAAYIIPAFSLILLGGLTGPFHTVTQKIITTLRTRSEDHEVPAVVATILVAVSAVMGLLAVGAYFGAPWLVRAVASQLHQPAFELAIVQMRVMAPMILIGGLVGVFCGISNDRGDYTLPSLSPLIASLAIIGVILLQPSPMALAWGTLLGAVGQFLLQAPAAWKLLREGPPVFPLRFKHPEVIGMWGLLLPASVSSTIGTLNVIIGTNFASSLPPGSMSVFDYANKLIQLPLGILMTALLIPLFPMMTQAVVANDHDALFGWMKKGLETIALATIPLMALFVAAGEPTVSVLYERGAFTPEDTRMTYMVLAIGALGIFTYAARDLFIRVFYALHDSRTPLMVSLLSMAMTAGLMALLIGPFGLMGLAGATALVTVANCLLVAFLLHRRLGRLALTGFFPFLLKVVVAATLAAAASWGVGRWLNLPPSLIGNFVTMTLQTGVLALGYVGLLILFKVPVVEQVTAIAGRFRKKKIAPLPAAEDSASEPLQQAP